MSEKERLSPEMHMNMIHATAGKSQRDFLDFIRLPCDYCKAPFAPLWCSQCKHGKYCNKECQKAQWKRHKSYCQHFPSFAEELADELERLDIYLANYEKHQHEPCPVCFEEKDSLTELVQLRCAHIYCLNCITAVEKKHRQTVFTCPMCREEPIQDLMTLSDWAIQLIITQAEYYERYDSEQARYYTIKAREEYHRLKRLVPLSSQYNQKRKHLEVLLKLRDLHILLLEGQYQTVIDQAERLEGKRQLLKELPFGDLELPLIKGIALEKLGHYQEAMSSFVDGFDLIPDDQHPLPSPLHRSLLNHMCFCGIRQDVEFSIFASAITAVTKDLAGGGIYELISQYYQDRNDWENAVLCLKAAIKFELPWIPEHKDRLRKKLDRVEEAKALYEGWK